MKKLSRFNQAFSEPMGFCDGSYVLSAELYPHDADAVAEFRRFFEDGSLPWHFDYSRVQLEAVRFSFPPDDVRRELGNRPVWMLGASGKGSKPVWVLPGTARLRGAA